MQEIFNFEQTGFENMKVQGQHVSTGIRPKFVDKLKAQSLSIPQEYFNKERQHTYLGSHSQTMSDSTNQQEPVIKKRLMQQNSNIFSQRLQK